MQLSELSRVAELGVGVNLAYCLVQLLERWSHSRAAQRVHSRVTELEKRFLALGATHSRPAIDDLGQIKAAHQRYSSIYGTVGIVLALLSAIGFSFVVAHCSINGASQTDDIWVVVLVVAMWFPPLAATLGQVGLYQDVWRQLDRRQHLIDSVPPEPS